MAMTWRANRVTSQAKTGAATMVVRRQTVQHVSCCSRPESMNLVTYESLRECSCTRGGPVQHGVDNRLVWESRRICLVTLMPHAPRHGLHLVQTKCHFRTWRVKRVSGRFRFACHCPRSGASLSPSLNGPFLRCALQQCCAASRYLIEIVPHLVMVFALSRRRRSDRFASPGPALCASRGAERQDWPVASILTR